jgi:hypothetical protein
LFGKILVEILQYTKNTEIVSRDGYHEIKTDLCLVWILQTWIDSFEIWYARKYGVLDNKEWK